MKRRISQVLGPKFGFRASHHRFLFSAQFPHARGHFRTISAPFPHSWGHFRTISARISARLLRFAFFVRARGKRGREAQILENRLPQGENGENRGTKAKPWVQGAPKAKCAKTETRGGNRGKRPCPGESRGRGAHAGTNVKRGPAGPRRGKPDGEGQRVANKKCDRAAWPLHCGRAAFRLLAFAHAVVLRFRGSASADCAVGRGLGVFPQVRP